MTLMVMIRLRRMIGIFRDLQIVLNRSQADLYPFPLRSLCLLHVLCGSKTLNAAKQDLKFKLRHYQKKSLYSFLILVTVVLVNKTAFSQQDIRQDISLDKNWRTIANDHNRNAFDGFEKSSFNDSKWREIEVPHNWDGHCGIASPQPLA